MSEETTPGAQAAHRAGAPALTGLSVAARAMPVALLASLPGLVFLAGFDHLAYGLGLLAGAVLAGLLIAPHVARAGGATIPDALSRRFGSATAVAGGVVVVLVGLPLLTAELAVVGVLAEAAFGLPYLAAVPATLALAAAAAVLLGDRGVGRLAAAAYALLAASLLVPLVLLAFKAHGVVVLHVAYGQALSTIAGLEETLLENGLVDFDTFGAHVTPFLRLSRLDLTALIVSLALGAAVLPHLATALAAERSLPAIRLAGAWTAVFVMLVLISVPALAAYAKLEIYRAMAANTPLASLPPWLEAPLGAGLAHIHGTSLAMLDEVAKAGAGEGESSAVADHLAAHAPALEARWLALDEQVRSAVVAAARTLSPGASAGDVWQTYVGHVLPAAAAAAGNEAATLTQAALVVEPAGLLLALPGLSGMPSWGAALMIAAVLAAGVTMATVLIRGLLAGAVGGGTSGEEGRATGRALALVLAAGAVAAGFAALRPSGLVTIVVSALSLGAAGLFPVLALGLAWKRATAAAAMAAIVAGAGVTLYYDIGIRMFSAAFYRTWAPLSNASEFAVEEFAALETEAREGESDEAKAAAATALETLARGTATRPGLANWLGIDSASGAVFGVPVGFTALVFVSLLTRARTRRHEQT